MPGTFSGTYTTGITLASNPNTITSSGSVSNSSTTINSGDAVYGGPGQSWTLSNSGVITGGTHARAVEFNDGGTILNQSTTGQINGNGSIFFGSRNRNADATTIGAAGSLDNNGIINLAREGISFFQGGVLTNGLAGSIYGSFSTISFLNAGTASVNNLGTISGNGYGDAIRVRLPTAAGTVTNVASGLITGGIGVSFDGAGPASITNYGRILGATTNVTTLGIQLYGGGTISNQASGTISGRNEGILAGVVTTAVATITNSGSIVGGQAGIEFQGFGFINNLTGAVIQGTTGSYGAVFINGSGGTNLATINNAGTITSTSSGIFSKSTTYNVGIVNTGTIFGNSRGITLSNGGSIVNGSTASSTALIRGAAYGVRASGTAATTVTNFGTITATSGNSVYFGSGNDRLIIAPTAAFNGGVNGGAGTNTLELLAGGSIGTITLGGTFFNFNTIAFDTGAAWKLTSTSFAATQAESISLASGAYADLSGTFGATETIALTGTTGQILLEDPNLFAGTITGLQAGETLSIVGTITGTPTYSAGVLNLTTGAGNASIHVPGTFTTSSFTFAQSGANTNITVAAASGPAPTPAPELYQFVYVYGDGNDYYYGNVATAAAGTYTIGQVINATAADQSGSIGRYQILKDLGSSPVAAGGLQVTDYYVGIDKAYVRPYATTVGKLNGTNGLGSEFDYVAPNSDYTSYFGTRNGTSPYYEVSREAQAVQTHLFQFEYVSGNSTDYYYGQVAAAAGTYTIGAVMRAAAPDQSGSAGFYEVLQDYGKTALGSGNVKVTDYFDYETGKYYQPYFASQGQSDSSAGLGTEFDYLNIHGGYTSYFGNISGPGSSTAHPYYLGS